MSRTETLIITDLSKIKYDEQTTEEFTFIDIYKFIKDNIGESERKNISIIDIKLTESTNHIHFIYFSADDLNIQGLTNLQTINVVSPLFVSSLFLYSKDNKIKFTFNELINNSNNVFELKHIIFDLYNVDVEIKKIINYAPDEKRKEDNDIGILQMTNSTIKYEEDVNEKTRFFIFNYYDKIYQKFITPLNNLEYDITSPFVDIYYDYYIYFNFYMFFYDGNNEKYTFHNISTANVLNISDDCYSSDDKIINNTLKGKCKDFYFSCFPDKPKSYKGGDDKTKAEEDRLNIEFNDKYDTIKINVKDLEIFEKMRFELNQYILYKHQIVFENDRETKLLYHHPFKSLRKGEQDFNIIEYNIMFNKSVYDIPFFMFSDQTVKIDFYTKKIELTEPPPEESKERKIDAFKSDDNLFIDIYDDEKNKSFIIPQFFDTYTETFVRNENNYDVGSYYEQLITFTESDKSTPVVYSCEPKEYINKINIPGSYEESNDIIKYNDFTMTYKSFYYQFKKFKNAVLKLYDELSQWKSLDNGEIDDKIKTSMKAEGMNYKALNQVEIINYAFSREYKVIKKYYIIDKMKESRYLIDAFIYTLNLMAYNYLKVIEWSEILKTWDY